jgi:hypothetical protein
MHLGCAPDILKHGHDVREVADGAATYVGKTMEARRGVKSLGKWSLALSDWSARGCTGKCQFRGVLKRAFKKDNYSLFATLILS